jgi:very-short-patch-repair endonuclease
MDCPRFTPRSEPSSHGKASGAQTAASGRRPSPHPDSSSDVRACSRSTTIVGHVAPGMAELVRLRLTANNKEPATAWHSFTLTGSNRSHQPSVTPGMNEPELRRYAAHHGGLLTTSTALALGCTRNQLRALVREHGWTHPARGTLAPPSEQTANLSLRAVQEVRPYLAASHRTAARLHGLPLLTDPSTRSLKPELTDPRPGRTGSRVTGVQIHRLPLPEHDVVSLNGIRTTGILRTLADLARSEPRNSAVALLDAALHERRCSREDLGDYLRTAPGRRSTTAAVTALTLADALAESPLESLARLLMHDAGLHPRPQAEVTTAQGSVRRVDFLFEPQGLAVETDGAEHHWSPAGQQRDLRRFNELATSPDLRAVLRFSWNDVVHHPHAFVTTVARHLAELS